MAMPVVVVAVATVWWQWRWGQLGGNTAVDTASIGVAATAQRRWWRYQCCKAAAWQHDGDNMRTRDYRYVITRLMMKAELMEENFGDEGEDDNPFSG